MAAGDLVSDAQHARGKTRARLAARPDEVLEFAVLVCLEQVRVRLTQLLERSPVQVAEEHLTQIVEQNRRVAGQRADALGGAPGADERAGVQRVDVAVMAVEVVGEQLDLTFAARASGRCRSSPRGAC